MTPLPKSAGWITTVLAVIAAIGTVLKLPFVHDTVSNAMALHPELAAAIAAIGVIVAAISHSLPGDGGDGSKPVN